MRGVDKEDINRGQVLLSQVQLLHTKFKAEVYVLEKEEGEDILHSLTDIVLNFILERLMLQVAFSFRLVLRW